jgi:hypothetical protein
VAPIRPAFGSKWTSSSGANLAGKTQARFITLKTSKTILAGLLACTLIGSASAQQTVLHVTGSTAYRAAVLVAISNILQPGYAVAYVASAPEAYSKANMVLFSGTTTSGLNVQIKTAFFGSIGGVCNVAGGLTIGPGGSAFNDGQTIGWLSSTGNETAPASVSGNVVSGGLNIPAGSAQFDPPAVADVTLSDSFQKSAPLKFRTPALTGEIVGVVPFVWVACPGNKATAGTKPSNITDAEIKLLLKGTLKLSKLSGNLSDTEHVYPVGRDQDSGTRIASLADSKYGITTIVKQYQPLFNGASAPANPPPTPPPAPVQVTGAGPWPAVSPVDTVKSPIGDSGYNSGGGVAGAVAVLSANPDWFIAYVGLNDAKTALTGANPNFTLSFNGTGLTNEGGVFSDLSPVEDGKYTFWGYEHFLYLPSLTGDQLSVAQVIETEILTSTAPVSGVLVADMTVHRNSDGGAIENGGNPPNKP